MHVMQLMQLMQLITCRLQTQPSLWGNSFFRIECIPLAQPKRLGALDLGTTIQQLLAKIDPIYCKMAPLGSRANKGFPALVTCIKY